MCNGVNYYSFVMFFINIQNIRRNNEESGKVNFKLKRNEFFNYCEVFLFFLINQIVSFLRMGICIR